MKRISAHLFSTYLVGLCLLLYGLSASALKPVAELVKRKHDLNIGFRNYRLFDDAQEVLSSEIREAISSGTTVNLIAGKLPSLVMQNADAITIEVPFNGNVITVELVSVNILTEDFSILSDKGTIYSYKPGVYYRGIIKGNPNSLASFSFFNNELYGIISDNVNGNIVVGRIISPGNINQYIIYSSKNLLQSPAGLCATADDTSESMRLQRLAQSTTTPTLNCVRFYYEVDHNLFHSNGSSAVNTTNWITAIHNNVATIYANDNITVALSQVYVWTSNDPYTANNSVDQLDLFRSTRPSFNGDVGQLVANDGGNGGLALDINALCGPLNYSYADVDLAYSAVPAYSWTVEVITHEFGHLLGSPHTHNCSWPGGAIDDCGPAAGYPTEGGCSPGPTPVNGGTIMSYCHLTPNAGINFSNGFGSLPAGAIQNAIDNATCLGTSCTVCLVPAHNACTTPATLSINANCIYTSGTLCGATESIPPITCGGRTATNAYDVWYEVTPSQNNMTIKCMSGTSTDVVLALYSGICGSLTLIDCSDATMTGGLETFAPAVTPGMHYYVRVYDFNGSTAGTDFGICVSQDCIVATNNGCNSAATLTGSGTCNFTDGELCSATESMNPSNCSGSTSHDAYDLWYKIIPTQSNVTVTCQSGVSTDMVVGIYSGVCGSLNLIHCTDSTGAGGIEIINQSLTIGNTYYIRVYDWNSNQYGTDFSICVQYIACSSPSPPNGASAASSTICDGASTSINASGTLSTGASWQWYKSSCGGTPVGTGASLNVSPSSTTTYYVRAETGTCYSTCRSVTVNVNQVPANPGSANSSPSSVCSGSSSALDVNGTLSSGASWHWYVSSCGGPLAGTGASINVSPLTTTTYYVRAENGNCFSNCVATTLGVTQVPNNPSSTSVSSSSICSGDNTMLTVHGTLISGSSWHWYKSSCGGTSVGTGASEIVSPSVTTTYYVRAENGNCYSNCLNTTITVLSIPNAPQSTNSSSNTLCEGESANLSVSGTLSGGSDWYWFTGSCGGTPAGQGSAILVSPLTTQTYFVRAENSSCESNCMSLTITVNPMPPQPVITVNNDILSVPPAASYQWYWSQDGSTFSLLDDQQQQEAIVDGYYFVIISDINGCENSSDTLNFQDPNQVAEHEVNKLFSVYPNPADDILNIKMKVPSNKKFLLNIFDDTGSLVYTANLSGQKISTIPLTSFSSGIYMLLISVDGKMYFQKILKVGT